MLTPAFARTLADVVLATHVAVVAFVVMGEVAFLAGAWRHWRWIRNLPLRASHVGLMVYIALQGWVGVACPLTTWELQLRALAGQDGYPTSFIEHWLACLIFLEAPGWVFIAAYTVFALLVVATWWWVPPRHRRANA